MSIENLKLLSQPVIFFQCFMVHLFYLNPYLFHKLHTLFFYAQIQSI